VSSNLSACSKRARPEVQSLLAIMLGRMKCHRKETEEQYTKFSEIHSHPREIVTGPRYEFLKAQGNLIPPPKTGESMLSSKDRGGKRCS